MVVWTDAERAAISGVFGKVDKDALGRDAVARCLIVYPWTQRYFAKFGNLNNATAIMENPNVAAHGKLVLGGLEKALKNLDDIKKTFAPLSELHSEKLHVDPDNFKLLADCITVVIAGQMGSAFTVDVHAALQKFMAVIVSALCRQYH